MYANRATLIGTLGKAADNGATNNPTSLAGSSGSRSDRAAGQRSMPPALNSKRRPRRRLLHLSPDAT